MTGMRLLGDLLLARLGMARMLRAFNALGAVALAVALLLARVDAAMVAFVVMGFGLATVVPSAYSAAARHADDVARRDGDVAHPARAIALISGFGYTGLLVGPPVVGWLAQAAGLGHALFLLVLLTAVIAVLVPLLGDTLRSHRPGPHGPTTPSAIPARARPRSRAEFATNARRGIPIAFRRVRPVRDDARRPAAYPEKERPHESHGYMHQYGDTAYDRSLPRTCPRPSPGALATVLVELHRMRRRPARSRIDNKIGLVLGALCLDQRARFADIAERTPVNADAQGGIPVHTCWGSHGRRPGN